MKRIILTALLTLSLLAGCKSETYDNFVFPEQEKNTLVPIGKSYTSNDYSGIAPVREETIASFSSDDGSCVIDRKEDYFDVTLDISDGDHYRAGAAYAGAVLKCDPDFEFDADTYLSVIISLYAADIKKSEQNKVLSERLDKMKAGLPYEYREEVEGFASAFSGDDIKVNDGKLSRTEACIFQLMYDMLNGYKGCAVSVSAERTENRSRLTSSVLYKQSYHHNNMLAVQAVVRFVNQDNTITSVNTLGMLNTVAAVNNSGLSATVIKSAHQTPFNETDSYSSCTFSVRQALESYSTAKDAGSSLLRYTDSLYFSWIVFLADDNEAISAEMICGKSAFSSALRTKDTPLLDGLEWNSMDCMCAVSRFAAEGLPDTITTRHNTLKAEYIHWIKLDSIFSGNEKISPERFKELLTIEKTNVPINRIREDDMMFMLITDHGSRSLQANLIGKDGVSDMPEFIDLGPF